MTRLPGWQRRFADLVRARSQAAFAWGQFDCVLWAADAVQALTGTDLAASMRGAYTNAAEAAHLLRQHGGIQQLPGQHLCPKPVACAQVGDVGLYAAAHRPTLVVCGGAHWLAAAPLGLALIPAAQVSHAWSAAHA